MNTEEMIKEAKRFASASYGEYEIEAFVSAMLKYVPDCSTVVEIGCQLGSSTSAILTVTREHYHKVFCVDPFTFEEVGRLEEIGPTFMRSMLTFGVPFAILVMKSYVAKRFVPDVIDMVHIDGDHSKEGLTLDCEIWLPRLRSGGLAIFHDYGRCGTPDVQPTVDYYTPGWLTLENNGMKVCIKP